MSIQKYLPSRPQERAHIVFLFPKKKMIAAEEAEPKDVTLDEREKGWADEGVWRFSNTGHIFTPYPAVLRHSLPISYVYTLSRTFPFSLLVYCSLHLLAGAIHPSSLFVSY